MELQTSKSGQLAIAWLPISPAISRSRQAENMQQETLNCLRVALGIVHGPRTIYFG